MRNFKKLYIAIWCDRSFVGQTANRLYVGEVSGNSFQTSEGYDFRKGVQGNTYYYLKYRDGKKVISKYVGKDDIEEERAVR